LQIPVPKTQRSKKKKIARTATSAAASLKKEKRGPGQKKVEQLKRKSQE